MTSDGIPRSTKWYVRWRMGLVPVIIGIVIVTFVATTGGKYGAWLMWIALPMLMLGLGYLFVVNVISAFLLPEPDHKSDIDQRKK